MNWFVKDLIFSTKHKNLTYLKVESQKQYFDLSLLKTISQLKTLTILNTPIYNLKKLKSLPEINYLRLENRSLKNANSLRQLQNIEYLSLQGNKIHDFSFTRKMKKLRHLHISKTSKKCHKIKLPKGVSCSDL